MSNGIGAAALVIVQLNSLTIEERILEWWIGMCVVPWTLGDVQWIG